MEPASGDLLEWHREQYPVEVAAARYMGSRQETNDKAHYWVRSDLNLPGAGLLPFHW